MNLNKIKIVGEWDNKPIWRIKSVHEETDTREELLEKINLLEKLYGKKN